MKTTCLHATVILYCECARGCDVSACAAGNKRIGSESARRETDWLVTDPGRSCKKSSDYDHWPVNRCISIFFPRPYPTRTTFNTPQYCTFINNSSNLHLYMGHMHIHSSVYGQLIFFCIFVFYYCLFSS